MPENQPNPFYNVMPEITNAPAKKAVVIPKQAQTPEQPTAPHISSAQSISIPAEKTTSSKKGKIIALSLGILLLLAGGGFFGYYTLYKKSDSNTQTNSDQTTNTQENSEVTTPSEWLQKFFGTETCTELATCGDKSDPDRDG